MCDVGKPRPRGISGNLPFWRVVTLFRKYQQQQLSASGRSNSCSPLTTPKDPRLLAIKAMSPERLS